MKKMKKAVALLLAMMMVLSMTITVFAEGNTHQHKITIKNESSNHVYEAYQVFSGVIGTVTTDDGEVTKLTDIEWGNGVDGAELLDALKTLENSPYEQCNSATEVAEVLAGFGDNSAEIKKFAELAEKNLTNTVAGTSQSAVQTVEGYKYEISVTGDGYYLIKDQNGSLGNSDSEADRTKGETYTEYLLKVVKDVEVTAKDGTVTSQKKVKDVNDSTGMATEWQDSADYDIGDYVPFQLKATLPGNFENYKKYSLTFHDNESTGLALVLENPDYPLKVYLDGKVLESNHYEVVVSGNEQKHCTFEVRIADVIATGATNNSVITVEYYSIVTEEAVVGSAGNPNTMHVSYTNNANDEQGGELGWTPDDTVIVFTYKTVINKKDADGKDLAGAEFTLEKFVKDAGGTGGTWTPIAVVKNEEGTTFTFSHIDDGEYRLHESKTPTGYNSIDDIYFTVTAEHEVLSDNPALTSLSGNVTKGSATFTYKLSDGSAAADIINRQGSTLPSTGGIGTTIFYVIGAVLVIGAGIVLITRKRMENE